MSARAVRIGAWAAYAALLGAGLIWIAVRDEAPPQAVAAPQLKAARALPVNHLLQASDILVADAGAAPRRSGAGGEASGNSAAAAPEESEEAAAARRALVGRYVVRPVAVGSRLGRADIAERPFLSLDGGAVLVGLGAPRRLVEAGRINAGREVLACSGDRQVATRSFVVGAVVCPSRGDLCTGFVRLGPDDRELGALFAPGLAPVMADRACTSANEPPERRP